MLDDAIRAHMPRRGSMAFDQYLELISVIRAQSTMLTPAAIRHSNANDQSMDRMMLALSRIAHRWHHWIEPLYTWQPDEHESAYVQFRSLVNHLFVKYDIPDFMTGCWFETSPETVQSIRLYVALGRGSSIRKCGIPIKFTKSMAKHFMLAPADLRVMQAVRWAQVMSLGGSESLARMIVNSRLKDPTPPNHEAFWEQFIRFLIRNEAGQVPSNVATRLHPSEVVSMIEYCHKHKFRGASETLGYEVLGYGPLQPNLSVKGQTVRWLRQRMANWQNEMELPAPTALKIRHVDSNFAAVSIEPYYDSEGAERWTIEQIRSSHMLQVEGGIMRHCVALYANRCKKGHTTIWSLQVHDGEAGASKRLATIEVWPSSMVINQVRGKSNSRPTEKALQLIRQWAEIEGLKWPADECK